MLLIFSSSVCLLVITSCCLCLQDAERYEASCRAEEKVSVSPSKNSLYTPDSHDVIYLNHLCVCVAAINTRWTDSSGSGGKVKHTSGSLTVINLCTCVNVSL